MTQGEKLIISDALEGLRGMPDRSVNCAITSPPYWALRDYDVPGQIGREETPEEYLAKLVEIFGQVRRVLKADGTLWLNIGDSYAHSGSTVGGYSQRSTLQGFTGEHTKGRSMARQQRHRPTKHGVKPKDLVGIPWRLAFALQADGWYLRSDIIWSKPNPMPESVADRPTKAHEYVFLLTKAESYYYDAEAIKEPCSKWGTPGHLQSGAGPGRHPNYGRHTWDPELGRNKRSVWEIPTTPYNGLHFAAFPEDLVKPCMLAGCPPGGTVLDPFFGSGTVAVVARRLNRSFHGYDIDPKNRALAKERLAAVSLPIPFDD